MENKVIKDFLKTNNNYAKTGEILKLGYSKSSISKLIKEGVIKKVAYGLYADINIIEDEFFIFQKKVENTVFSYNTACYLLNLSDRAPYELDIATTRNHKIRNQNNVKVYYIAEDKFDIGIIEITSPYGNSIKVYNAERCICDILKNPNAVDIELYNKIINNYFKSKNKDLNKLEEYSKIFNVHKKFEHIMEVLI